MQLVLYKAEMGSYFGKRDIFRDHAKFVFSDFYQQHFQMRRGRVLLLTSRRVMMVQVGSARAAGTLEAPLPSKAGMCSSCARMQLLGQQKGGAPIW